MKYRETSQSVSDLAVKGFRNHLWYLSEESVALSFFDPLVSVDTKFQMVAKLHCPSLLKKPRKKFSVSKDYDLSQLECVDLSYFVSTSTMSFFSKLGLSTSFLDLHPSEWPNDESYIRALDIVKGLHVVNDVAERAVALVKDYNCNLTKSETNYQNLLQVSFILYVERSCILLLPPSILPTCPDSLSTDCQEAKVGRFGRKEYKNFNIC